MTQNKGMAHFQYISTSELREAWILCDTDELNRIHHSNVRERLLFLLIFCLHSFLAHASFIFGESHACSHRSQIISTIALVGIISTRCGWHLCLFFLSCVWASVVGVVVDVVRIAVADIRFFLEEFCFFFIWRGKLFDEKKIP